MSDNQVRVPRGSSQRDTAVLLLAAAEETGQDVHVVQVSTLGGFTVPESVAKAAGVKFEPVAVADGSRYNESQIADGEKAGLRALGGDHVAGQGLSNNDFVSTDATPVAEDEDPEPKVTAKKTAAKKTTEKGA